MPDFLFLLQLVLANAPDPMKADATASSSDHGMSILVIQIVVAVIGGLVPSLIMYLMNRSRSKTDQLQTRADSTTDMLRSAEVNQIRASASELKGELRSMLTQLNELQRSHDRQPNECSERFVDRDAYKREMSAQKEYVRLLYAAIKHHLVKLEADLGDESDD